MTKPENRSGVLAAARSIIDPAPPAKLGRQAQNPKTSDDSTLHRFCQHGENTR